VTKGRRQALVVEPQGLSINLAAIRPAMAIRAEGDEIAELMRTAFFPWHDMVNVNFWMSAGMNCTAMPCLDQYGPPQLYWDSLSGSHVASAPSASSQISYPRRALQ